MVPLFDENPTSRRPYLTALVIVVTIIGYLLGNYWPGGTAADAGRTTVLVEQESIELPDDLRLTLRYATIPCEIMQQRPLTIGEVSATYFGSGDTAACDITADGPAVFPEKHVFVALASSLFLHGSLLHLAANMLFLWVFGNNIEDRLGHVGFLAFYLGSGVVATVAYVAFQPAGTVAILGASGAVAGIMGSYLIWYPDAPIRTLVFLILVDIRARWFLVVWLAIQSFTWTEPGAWIAHVAGFVFGAISGRIIRKIQPRLRLRPGQLLPSWDNTGGAGHGPYPHLGEVWNEPHHEYYERP